MIAIIFQLALLALIGYGIYRGGSWLVKEVFSDSKRCPRCDGKGWWQNTRNRDKCEWCKGTGRISKKWPT